MLSIGPIKQDHSTMKHPLSSPAGHVRRRYNGNAPPPGVPLSAVPDPHLSSRGLCEMTRRHRRRRINALQTSINTSQTVAESAGRDARALRVRRAGWGLTRVDRPAPAPGPPAPRRRAARACLDSRVCVDRRLHVWRRRETLTCQQVTPTFSLDFPACGGRPLS